MTAHTGDARDATQGIPVADLTNDILQARVGGEDVLLVKRDSHIFAIGARCRAPGADGGA